MGNQEQGRQRWGALSAGVLLIVGLPLLANAAVLDLGDSGFTGSADLMVTAGARVRTQERNPSMISKTNLPGQQSFCDDKNGGINCGTVAGNASYLALPGSLLVNGDNGDLNYDKGDLVNGVVKLSPRLQLTYDNFGLDVSALYFYDAINNNFDEYHPNNVNNHGFQPEHTQRAKSANREIGSSFELLNAYVSGAIPVTEDHDLRFKVGNFVLNQGQSSFLVLNSLNVINPPDVNVSNLPGADIKEIFKPVPLIALDGAVTADFSLQGFYQFQWVAAPLIPQGSYFSTTDPIGPGATYAQIGNGKNREDPMDLVGKQGRLPGVASLISKAGRTNQRAPDQDARNSGEYGLAASYFAHSLNDSTFGLYYRNLHSRVPIFSYKAAQQSCAYNATNAVDATAACGGFMSVPTGLEAAPVDTAKYFLEYPEDIHSYGFNFTTSLGSVAWSGEVVYRPNQPLQVDPVDVGFAALQPAFPKQTISLAVQDIPGQRVAAPDYLYTGYLKQAVEPGQTVHGYIRRKTFSYQTSFLYSGGASDNPFGATSITALVELGAYQVIGLPGLDQLQLAGPGTATHHSAGIDGTGIANSQQQAVSAADRQNATSQTGGYATSLSFGARSLIALEYNDVFEGIKLVPVLGYFHDIHGTAPLPTGEFISGRKQIVLQLQFNYFDRFFGGVSNTWYLGGGQFNLLRDRGNIAAFIGCQL